MVFFLNSCVKRDQDSTFTALVPGTNYCIYGGGGGWEGLVLVVLEVKGIAIYFDVSCYNFQDCHCQCLINNQGLKQYLKRVCDMDTLLEMLLQGWLLKGWFNCNENLGLKLKFCFDFLLLFCSCDLNSDPLLCLLNLEISV